MFTLDTNILIYFIQGEKQIVEQINLWRKSRQEFFISVITKIELLSYPKITLKEIEKINKFLPEFNIIILDEQIAEKAAYLRRKYRILLADAIIAATASQTKSLLITRDIKHFQKIKEIKVETI